MGQFTSRTELTLDERIEYISRAVMCAKSCNQQTSASHEGEFLHELEEKMEVINGLIRGAGVEILSKLCSIPL